MAENPEFLQGLVNGLKEPVSETLDELLGLINGLEEPLREPSELLSCCLAFLLENIIH